MFRSLNLNPDQIPTKKPVKKDKERWNARYKEFTGGSASPDNLLVSNSGLLSRGRGLDLACGHGANSIFLAGRGYWVDALDISHEGVRQAQSRARGLKLEVGWLVADLDDFPIPQGIYDVTLVFYFYSEPLLPKILGALKPTGLLYYSTYNYRHTSLKPDFKPEYLVPEGGLGRLFPGLRILLDEPEAGSEGNLSRLIAQKY